MNNPDYYQTNELVHRYAGNGFYFVRNEPQPGYVLVAGVTREGNIAQNGTAIAHVEMLEKFTMKNSDGSELEFPMSGKTKALVEKLRADLESGKIVRQRGYLVDA